MPARRRRCGRRPPKQRWLATVYRRSIAPSYRYPWGTGGSGRYALVEAELKSFFGLNAVMGYKVGPCLPSPRLASPSLPVPLCPTATQRAAWHA